MSAPERETIQQLRERIAATLHLGLDDATPNEALDGSDHDGWVERLQEWADWIHAQYEPYLDQR